VASNVLQDLVAELAGTEPAAVHPDFAFAGTRLQGSLARARLHASIEQQLGVTCAAAFTARTFGELHAAIHGSSSATTSSATNGVPASPPSPTPPGERHRAPVSMACGIDIEMVASLPVVTDYWSDAFYRATFTDAEIAYCLLQDQPVQHFAARWCAKEALKKCDATYLQADLRAVEVALTANGAPYLCAVRGNERTSLPFAVSLSHTPVVAVAVVVRCS
jgi:phosphopantetheine--protein transferase-like protein